MTTPVSLTNGLAPAGSRAIRTRSGAALQAAGQPDPTVLERTGTIPIGRAAVTDVVPAPGFEIDAILAMAAVAERDSEHRLAAAIMDGAVDRGLTPLVPTRSEAVAGHGIRAWLGSMRVLVGDGAFLEAAGVNPDALANAASRLTDQGKTSVFVALGDRAAGVIAIADPHMPDSRSVIAAPRTPGPHVVPVAFKPDDPVEHDLAGHAGHASGSAAKAEESPASEWACY